MKKRSVKIAGHATSITMEDEFWTALKTIAAREGQSLNTLITNIDDNSATNNLSSAIRVFILNSLKD